MKSNDHLLVENLVILGVGLMGGSLALAAKRAGVVGRVTGWSRTQKTLDAALSSGVIDVAESELDKALENATMVVVATPTQFTEQIMIDVLERVSPDVTVTDVASVKGNVHHALVARFDGLPKNAVLAHPIAGSEKSGVNAAFADLYVDRRVILIDDAANETSQVELTQQLWEAIGAQVDFMSADKHDAVLALTLSLIHI